MRITGNYTAKQANPEFGSLKGIKYKGFFSPKERISLKRVEKILTGNEDFKKFGDWYDYVAIIQGENIGCYNPNYKKFSLDFAPVPKVKIFGNWILNNFNKNKKVIVTEEPTKIVKPKVRNLPVEFNVASEEHFYPEQALEEFIQNIYGIKKEQLWNKLSDALVMNRVGQLLRKH